MLDAIDDWRYRQNPILSAPKAIRSLIAQALEATGRFPTEEQDSNAT
jgi:hypothetical protein